MNTIVLEYGGETRGFTFGTWVIGQLIAHLNCTADDLEDHINKNPIMVIPLIIYYSAVLYNMEKEKPIDFKEFHVHDWIAADGGLGGKKSMQIMDSWIQASTRDVPVIEAEDDQDDKKKLTG